MAAESEQMIKAKIETETIKLPDQEQLLMLWRSIDPSLDNFRFIWSTKMKSVAARIFLRGNKRVILSVRQFLAFGEKELELILRHEAAHALVKHTGHSRAFRKQLTQTNGSRYCKTLPYEIYWLKLRRVGETEVCLVQ